MALEAAAIDHVAQVARIADLEADLRTVRELFQLTLTQLHDALEREKRLTWRVRELTDRARSLRRAA